MSKTTPLGKYEKKRDFKKTPEPGKSRPKKGRYALVKLKPREPGDKNWLFFKIKTPV